MPSFSILVYKGSGPIGSVSSTIEVRKSDITVPVRKSYPYARGSRIMIPLVGEQFKKSKRVEITGIDKASYKDEVENLTKKRDAANVEDVKKNYLNGESLTHKHISFTQNLDIVTTNFLLDL